MREVMHLRIPQTKLSEFCQSKGYGNYQTLIPSPKPFWIKLDVVEILLAYNAEMRGIANYYSNANGAKEGLRKLMYMARSSFLATLASKHDSTISKELAKYRHGSDIVATIRTKEGKIKRYTLFTLKNWKPLRPKDDIDNMPSYKIGRSTLEQRLNKNCCESCGKTGGYFEVHHVRKLKDL